jgi:hypothetical protein
VAADSTYNCFDPGGAMIKIKVMLVSGGSVIDSHVTVADENSDIGEEVADVVSRFTIDDGDQIHIHFVEET